MYFFKLLFVIFAIATFLKPACFDILGFNTINTFLNISRIFVAGIIFINYLFIKRKPLSRLLKYECLFFSFWFISTLISGEGFSQLSVFSISIIAFTMLIELLIASERKNTYQCSLYQLFHFDNSKFYLYDFCFWIYNKYRRKCKVSV